MARSTWQGVLASARRIGFALALVVMVWLTGMVLYQHRLLYFPEPASVEATLAATGLERARPWPDGAGFRGVRVEPAAGPARATLVVFHGNAGHAGHRGEYAERFGALGWRVILAEYPGYGARPGALGEASLVADARQTLARARADFGGPLYVLGESLGAGVAAAGAQGNAIDGLLLVTPWDTLAKVAAHHYRWLPVRLLLSDRYDSVAALKDFGGPTLVVLAGEDRIVPARFGRALYDALPGRKALRVVAGADHNDWIERVDDAWWRELAGWLSAGP